MKFTLSIPQTTVQHAYQDVLKEFAAEANIKGFRKGKAPVDVVEKSLDKAKVYEHVVSHILPPAYTDYVKKNNLLPIADPKIAVKSLTDDKDWEFEVEIAEKPEVTLGKYQDAVKAAKTKDAIWTPDKGDAKDSRTQEQKDNEALSKAFDAILEVAKVDVPELLVEQEVNRALSQLLEQVNKLGLTIDSYLKSINKTSESLRQEYAKTATDNLKLEFILDAIAHEEKITAAQEEVDAFINTIQDASLKAKVQKDAMQLAAIRMTLVKRKVVDYLLHL